MISIGSELLLCLAGQQLKLNNDQPVGYVISIMSSSSDAWRRETENGKRKMKGVLPAPNLRS